MQNWSRQQKRVFQRLTSWTFEAVSRGAQLLRVDLTTAVGGDRDLLRRRLFSLRRAVEREFGYKGVEYFTVDTTEGNGVLHMVWAWVGTPRFYIPQAWLSERWKSIHGAPIVYVRRMRAGRSSIRNVARYFAIQYLADQGEALNRMSWSWKRARVMIGRNWEQLKRVCSWTWYDDQRKRWQREYHVPMADMIGAWEKLLKAEDVLIGDCLYGIRQRSLVELF